MVEEWKEMKSMKAVITRKSHLFGLVTPVDTIYFDTLGHYASHREASLNNGWKVAQWPGLYDDGKMTCGGHTINFCLTGFQTRKFPEWKICIYTDSAHSWFVRLSQVSKNTWDIRFDPEILNYENTMDVAHLLITMIDSIYFQMVYISITA